MSATTCYFRNLQTIFRKVGITVTKKNKRDLDQIIHKIVHVEYKNCAAAWKEVKNKIAANEEEFVSKLKEAWEKRV